MKYGFGVDVGGTTVKMGLFTADGTLTEKWEIPTRTAEGGRAILPDIAASIEDCLIRRGIAKRDVLGIGIGFIANYFVNQGYALFERKKSQ